MLWNSAVNRKILLKCAMSVCLSDTKDQKDEALEKSITFRGFKNHQKHNNKVAIYGSGTEKKWPC